MKLQEIFQDVLVAAKHFPGHAMPSKRKFLL